MSFSHVCLSSMKLCACVCVNGDICIGKKTRGSKREKNIGMKIEKGENSMCDLQSDMCECL